MASAAEAAAQIAAAVAAEAARAKGLIDVIGFVALNGYAVNVFNCIWLSRAFYEDRALNEAVVNVQRGRWKLTLLMSAAQKGCVSRAEALLAYGADVNLRGRSGSTAAVHAYWAKREAMVRLLLQQPGLDAAAHVEILARLGMTERVVTVLRSQQPVSHDKVLNALLEACSGGHRDTAVAILAARPDLDVNSCPRQWSFDTLLIETVRLKGVRAVVTVLSLPGVDVNAAVYDGVTALHAACVHSSDPRVLQQLLAVPGVNVNVRNSHGSTALMVAVLSGRDDAVAQLLAMPGINVNTTDHDGCTVLMHAAAQGYPAAVAALLTAPDIYLASISAQGRTALQIAQHQGTNRHVGQGQDYAACVSLLRAAEAARAAAAK